VGVGENGGPIEYGSTMGGLIEGQHLIFFHTINTSGGLPRSRWSLLQIAMVPWISKMKL